jgi:hypothetical protein
VVPAAAAADELPAETPGGRVVPGGRAVPGGRVVPGGRIVPGGRVVPGGRLESSAVSAGLKVMFDGMPETAGSRPRVPFRMAALMLPADKGLESLKRLMLE